MKTQTIDAQKHLYVCWVCLLPLNPRGMSPTQPLESRAVIHFILEDSPASRHDTGLTELQSNSRIL